MQGGRYSMGLEGGSGGILIADPAEQCRFEMSNLLRDAGHEPSGVASGEEALQAARNQRPRLIILEICLPGICGYEVCLRLRNEYADTVSIMFVSGTRTESFDRAGGILLGADVYLSKPLAADEFLAQVGRLIRRPATSTSDLALRLWERGRRGSATPGTEPPAGRFARTSPPPSRCLDLIRLERSRPDSCLCDWVELGPAAA